MAAAVLAALELVGKLLANDDFALAKKVIGRVLRIAGETGTEEHRALVLRGYLEGTARYAAQAATTLTMRRNRALRVGEYALDDLARDPDATD